MNCAACGHPETDHTAATTGCYWPGCRCDRFAKPATPTQTEGTEP